MHRIGKKIFFSVIYTHSMMYGGLQSKQKITLIKHLNVVTTLTEIQGLYMTLNISIKYYISSISNLFSEIIKT